MHHTNVGLLCDTITTYAKKHGQLKQAIARMVQAAMAFAKPAEAADAKVPSSIYTLVTPGKLTAEAMETDDTATAEPKDPEHTTGAADDRIAALMQQARAIGDTGFTDETKLRLLESLREVTEGKVFVEVERARISRMMADLLYAAGDVSKAADVLQDLAVETFGSLDRREKVDFILEQMRLNMERNDFHRVNLFSRKVQTKFFEEEANEDLKLRYYDLMVRLGMHDRKHLEVSKYYREVLASPSIQADDQKKEDALRNAILFLVLAPYDNEQSDLMARVESMEPLESVPEYKSLLKCFTTPELMRWPGIEAMYGAPLRATPVFSGSDDAEARWKELHTRVVEHNVQVVSKYYAKIRLERLAQLLDLSTEQAEDALAELVVKGTIHARIDRPSKMIDFEMRVSDADVLNNWSNDMSKLLSTVEKVSHLVEKEWAIQRAGLVVRANE